MAETNKESTGQEPTDQADKKTAADKKAAAEKKAAAASPESETKPVADLLFSILNDVQEQVQTKAAVAAPTAAEEPLKGKALEAVEQFRDIVAALALAPTPTILLEVDDDLVGNPGDEATLFWSSTGHRVSLTARENSPGSIEQDLGVLTPAAGGSIKVAVFFAKRFSRRLLTHAAAYSLR